MPGDPNKLSRFWQELRRRRVIQVIIVYATAAFMILEAVDIVFPRLNFPDWTVSFVMILLAIGFPLAVIFSWIFDYTPKGFMRTKSIEEIRTFQGYEENQEKSTNYSNLWSRIIPWSLGLLVVAMVLLLWIFRWNKGSIELPLIASVHVLPEGEIIKSNDFGAALAFSPDGSTLVYAAEKEDTQFLYKKKMEEFEAEQIPGTEGGYAPFFSPDGRWIGFFADGKLKKVSMGGGAPQLICETYPGYEGTWGKYNSIVYCDNLNRGLWRVSSDGGDPLQLTTAMTWSSEGSEHSHFWPSMLPGGKSFLYTIWHNSEDMRIALYSFETGQSRTLLQAGSHATYIKTGHLVYIWKGDLMTVPFDLRSKEVIGQPTMIIQDVMMHGVNGLGQFSISGEGSLAYIPGKYERPVDRVIQVDLDSNYTQLELPPRRYQNPVYSPGGKNLLITTLQEKSSIWVYGLERGTFQRLTNKDFESFWAIWTPDGKQVVFNSNQHGGDELNLYAKSLDGTGVEERITTTAFNQQPKTWSGDGSHLVYLENVYTETGWDIYMINNKANSSPVPLFNTRFNEAHPTVSPDGKWLAYVSDEPGQFEVFICSFPSLDQRTPISNDGGTEPVWSPDGSRLYYRDYTGNRVMAVSLSMEPALTPGKPEIILEGTFKPGYVFGRNFDIHPDGGKFLMIQSDEFENEASRINIIHNWSEELDSYFKQKSAN